MDGNGTLESALASTQADAEAALQAVTRVAKALRRARSAAIVGEVRELGRTLDSAQRLTAELEQTVSALAAGYTFDAAAYLSAGGYVEELLAAAAAAELTIVPEDDVLLCFPALVRVLAGELAVAVDRRKERRLRPSALVAVLAAVQRQGPRFRPEPFLASLQRGYDLVLAERRFHPGDVVGVRAVYDVLTVLPGQSTGYPRPEFARDLYLLDESRMTTAKDGRRLRWAASSGTRGSGVLTTVSRSGQLTRYYGIAFEGASQSGSP